MKKIFYAIPALIIAFTLSLSISPQAIFAQVPLPSSDQNKALQSNSASLDVKVAPGELLPVSVKLSNFGGGKRVDITLSYLITSDKGVEIYKTTETVAVETTNNFIKTIQIPDNTPPGTYTAKTSIIYQGQVTPATTQFSFKVERKILGLYQNEFFLYGGGTLFLSLLMVGVGYMLVKRRDLSRYAPINYSHVPHHERVFYELVSDTVLGMRQKVGDRALHIASKVDGLKIDPETGRILKLTKTPSKIIAELVSGYEKSLGEKVSFSFREQNN